MVENQIAINKGKEGWMTEHLDTLSTYAASLNTAVEIHDCFTKANFSAYIWWYGKRFYGLIGQDGAVTKRGYVVSQFSRFIKEGATRLGSTSNSRAEVLISAYKNGAKKVIVAINSGPVDIRQKISFQGASAVSVIPYLTNSSKNVEQGPAVSITDNSFFYTVPSKSIVTFVEQ
jgi:glucuronoarabinoxylan endo-1,4-beta-xylanase